MQKRKKKALEDLENREKEFIRGTFARIMEYFSRQESKTKILSKKRRAKMEPSFRI